MRYFFVIGLILILLLAGCSGINQSENTKDNSTAQSAPTPSPNPQPNPSDDKDYPPSLPND